MNHFQESVFMSEIIFQADMADHAAKRLKEIANNSNRYEVWGTIQLILIAAGNVSKILWPAWEVNKARGVQLRSLLGIADDNILSDRKFRNHFEHYDERIEIWTENRKGFIDWAMNPSFYQCDNENISRGYDTSNNTVIFQGETLDLDAVLEALKEVRGKCIK